MQLPAEITLTILEKLPVCDVLTYGTASHAAHDTVVSDYLWSSLARRDFPEIDVVYNGIQRYAYAAITHHVKSPEHWIVDWTRMIVLAIGCNMYTTLAEILHVQADVFSMYTTLNEVPHKTLRIRGEINDAVHMLLLRSRIDLVMRFMDELATGLLTHVGINDPWRICILFTNQMCREDMLSMSRSQYAALAVQYEQFCLARIPRNERGENFAAFLEALMSARRGVSRRGTNGAIMDMSISNVLEHIYKNAHMLLYGAT